MVFYLCPILVGFTRPPRRLGTLIKFIIINETTVNKTLRSYRWVLSDNKITINQLPKYMYYNLKQ